MARMMRLHESPEGQSVLLALALSIRLCSKADDRSPKPFISKEALTRKFGQHLDPAFLVYLLHLEIQRLYGTRKRSNVNVQLRDMTERMTHVPQRIYSHVITSPPYLNAQDYYRNFKLELAFLSKLTETPTPRSEQFIGTERGPLMARVTLMDVEQNKALLPQLEDLERKSPRHAEIVHRYLADMRTAIIRLQKSMVNDGSLVIVCGDNLVCRTRINTWRVLNRLIESNGFTLFDSFDDPIRARALAPSRAGHKGLIKEERISAFRLVRPH
ncbi:MAG: hypothetical protein HYY78_14320 [Betaproteobacteria bacterium]|nr:hypothetical protein [Betaproteobacteria bacterium]